MTIKCSEIWVRPIAPGHHAVRIDRFEVTACHYLSVEVVDKLNLVVISYMNSQDKSLKKICYNLSSLLEFSCEGELS